MNLRVNNRQEKEELAIPHPEQGGETWLTGNSFFFN